MKNHLSLAVSILMVAVVAYVTILPFCGLIFSCGCSLQSGILHCNIFEAGQPDCPWCSQSRGAFWTLFFAINAAFSGTIWLAFRRISPGIGVGLAAGIVGYIVWGSLAGLAYALVRDYPTFYGGMLP
ncbi:MAG: hypothetical protein V3R94_11965 [Acidobacteriota bacterium]